MKSVGGSVGADQGLEIREENLRKSTRERTICRIASVRTEEDEGLARVKNLSDEGMMIRLSLDVGLGDDLDIRLSETVSVRGQVVWIKGPDCGVKLAQPLDSSTLLRHLATQEKSREVRALRLPLATDAVVSGQMGIRTVAVDNISQRGMKIQHDGTLAEGMPVTVSFRSGLQCRGVVRWSQDGIAGIMFLEAISPETLGSARSL